MNLGEICSSSKQNLSVDEENFLINKNYIFNKKTPKRILMNSRVLANSLKFDYTTTIDALRNYVCNNKCGVMGEKASFEIHKILIKNGFVLDKNNINLINYNPLFLISSLENNFSSTIKILEKTNKAKITIVPFYEKESVLLENVLQEHDFILTKANCSLIQNSASFLFASLNNDFERTLEVLKTSDISVINMDVEQIKSLIDIVFYENKRDFKSLPSLLKNIIVIFGEECCIDDITYFKKMIIENKIPLSYFSSRIFSKHKDLIKFECNNDKALAFVQKYVCGFRSSEYSEKLEQELLGYLKVGYKECFCVEDVLKVMIKRNRCREDLTILEMIAIQFYAVKELNKKGLTYNIDLFKVDENMERIGECIYANLNLYINGSCSTIEEMLIAVEHEMVHLFQKQHIIKGDIIKESDVDLYSKDCILQEIIGDSYYYDNYNRLSYEIDADTKAIIKFLKLKLLNNEFKSNENLWQELSKYKPKIINRALQKAKDVYEHSLFRFDEETSSERTLDDLFQEKMENLRVANSCKYSKIIQQYPIIKYEYNTGKCFRRKTIEELINDLDNYPCSIDKVKCYFLLLSRIDENKDKNFEENNLKLIDVYNKRKYKNETTGKMLKKIIYDSEFNQNKKYVKYFYSRNSGVKRTIKH